MLPLGLLCLSVCLLVLIITLGAQPTVRCAVQHAAKLLRSAPRFKGTSRGVDKHVSPPIRLKANPTPTEWLARQTLWDLAHHAVDPNVHVA